jgi:N-acetylglucosamine-6-sulfatase
MHAHGVVSNFARLRPDSVTFPRLLRNAGYRTAFIGKWHMGDAALAGGEHDDSDTQQPGFDRWVAFRGQGEYLDPVLNIQGERRQVKGQVTDILTEEAVRFLRASADRPFLLYLSHKAVHADFFAPERHRDLYSRDPVPIPATAADAPENVEGKPRWAVRKRRESRHGLAHLYEGSYTLESLYRKYCRALMALDESVARVYDELRALNRLDDTLIVYMGDNGFLLGEQGLVDKRVMYEPSIRVPMLAHCPGLFRPGTVVEGMALNLDIAPTFLAAAGLPAPRSMHGRPLLPGAAPPRIEFLCEYFWDYEALHTPSMCGLRTPDYSFTEYQGIWDCNELYDLKRDPLQRRNLLASAEITTQPGGWLSQAKPREVHDLAADLHRRMAGILNATGGEKWYSGPPA